MKLVIDSNMLQSPLLRDYLSGATTNFVVWPELVWLEVYKQQSLSTVSMSLSIVRDFPDQVLMLRSAEEIAQIVAGAYEMSSAMLKPEASSDLRQIVEALERAARGDDHVISQLKYLGVRATEHMQGMLEGASDILKSLPEMAEMFTGDEVRRCRTNSGYTEEMFEKIFGAANQIFETLFESQNAQLPSDMAQRSNAYLYRYSLSIVIYLLWWIRNGSQVPKRIDRARNDFIDLSLSVCGSYFDGFLTADAKAQWMHLTLCDALRTIKEN